MKIIPIKTRIFTPPKDDIYDLLDKYCVDLREKDVLLISSKIISIHEGRCLEMKNTSKNALVKKEADHYIKHDNFSDIIFTIKNKTIIPFAGIDERNSNGHYILWPKNPYKSAQKICNYLKKKRKIKKLALIITDSYAIAMRAGMLGISIGFSGLRPSRDYKNKKDIFNEQFQMEQANIVDALAAAGVLAMSEGDEKQPMAIIRNASFIDFTSKNTKRDLDIPLKEDLYYPILKKKEIINIFTSNKF